MSRPVEWLAGADADLQTVFARHEDRRQEAGENFLSLIEACLGWVSRFPKTASACLQRIRRQVMNRSVDGIFYVAEPTRIIAVALPDQRPDARQTRRRLTS